MAYFSNGSEGMVLDEQCCDCIDNAKGRWCPIRSLQVYYNYKQNDNKDLTDAMNMLINEKGMTRKELNARCIEGFGVAADYLSKSDASSLIEELIGQ